MGWVRVGAAVAALGALLLVACTDPGSTDATGGSPEASPSPSGLPLTYTGAVLHAGNYCHFDQVVTPGNNTLPVKQGCLFSLTKPADVFATDGADYSVSEVVGDAQLGVRGPADSRVMVVCRLSPRIQFWFWVSADGHWNISSVADVHNPQDLVSLQVEAAMQPFVKVGGARNYLQFMCAGGATSHEVTLALNVNEHQFAALTVPMPAANVPLDRPSTPWFVDIGARMVTAGDLEGAAAVVTLYSSV